MSGGVFGFTGFFFVDMSFDTWSIHFGDFFFTLTGSVHFVNYGLDPWWVRPLCGLVLTLGGVRPLCGFCESF